MTVKKIIRPYDFDFSQFFTYDTGDDIVSLIRNNFETKYDIFLYMFHHFHGIVIDKLNQEDVPDKHDSQLIVESMLFFMFRSACNKPKVCQSDICSLACIFRQLYIDGKNQGRAKFDKAHTIADRSLPCMLFLELFATHDSLSIYRTLSTTRIGQDTLGQRILMKPDKSAKPRVEKCILAFHKADLLLSNAPNLITITDHTDGLRWLRDKYSTGLKTDSVQQYSLVE